MGLKARGKIVCVPYLTENGMDSCIWEGEEEKTAFGFLQPKTPHMRTCSVCLTPLLAADGAGYRLGYGGGYYDRYFAKNPAIVKVGLCFEGQVVSALPRLKTDIPLNALITERKVTVFSDCSLDKNTGKSYNGEQR